MGWRNLSKTAETSSSSPRTADVFFCLSVCPSVRNTKTRRFNVGIKIRVPKWSFLSIVHPPQIPIPMCEKKIRVQQGNRRSLLIVYVYYQPNSCNTHAEHEWAGGTFLRQQKKVPPAHAQWV